jgi:hypothetical protein
VRGPAEGVENALDELHVVLRLFDVHRAAAAVVVHGQVAEDRETADRGLALGADDAALPQANGESLSRHAARGLVACLDRDLAEPTLDTAYALPTATTGIWLGELRCALDLTVEFERGGQLGTHDRFCNLGPRLLRDVYARNVELNGVVAGTAGPGRPNFTLDDVENYLTQGGGS